MDNYPTPSREQPQKSRMERVQLAVALVALTLVFLVSLAGFGYFFIPVALFAAFTWLAVLVMRNIDFRNRFKDQRPTLSERYADGQPEDRAEEQARGLKFRERDERPPVLPEDEPPRPGL